MSERRTELISDDEPASRQSSGIAPLIDDLKASVTKSNPTIKSEQEMTLKLMRFIKDYPFLSNNLRPAFQFIAKYRIRETSESLIPENALICYSNNQRSYNLRSILRTKGKVL